MGSASKACSVVSRFFALASAAIVVGLLGQYLSYVASANDHANSRVVYTVVLGGISIVVSLLLFFPARYTFWAFPLDFSLFVMWITAFGLLANLSSSRNCTSSWYWNSWGYYWGGWYRSVPVNTLNQGMVGTAACAQWRTVLSFSFIGAWCWFTSGILGIYVVTKDHGDEDGHQEIDPNTSERKPSYWKRSAHGGSDATTTTTLNNTNLAATP